MVHPNKRLTAERLQKLESIEFAWVAKYAKNKTQLPSGNSQKAQQQQKQRRQRLNDAQWEEMYRRLIDYKETYGDCLVPRKFQGDPKLATWVETQRVLYNRDCRAAAAATLKASPTEERPSVLSEPVVEELLGVEAVPEPVARLAEVPPVSSDSDPEIPPVPTDPVLEGTNSVMLEDSPLEDLLQGKRLTEERKQKLNALGFVWSLRSKRIEDHWDEMYGQLVDYKKVNGDCLVPSRFESNLKLGKWVETQRYEYTKLQRAATGTLTAQVESDPGVTGDTVNAATTTTAKVRPTNGRLTEDRLKRLEAIGFEWRVKHKMKRYYDKQWDVMFQRLLQFKQINGNCLVPKRYPPDMKLGTWVHTQRIQYRKLTANSEKAVTEEEVAKLLAGQNNDPTLTEEEKAAIQSVTGRDEVTTYRLTEARRKRLEEVGFVWCAQGAKGPDVARIVRNTYDDQWDNMFEKLVEYKNTHGDCLVPKRYKENPKLGTWVDTQRVQFKKLHKMLLSQGQGDPSTQTKPVVVGRLTEDRIQRLQRLGFVWSLRDDWQKHYEELKDFKQEHGHCNVPARYEKNRRLGIWVSAQRQQCKIIRQGLAAADPSTPDGKPKKIVPLTNERIALLNELGFTWTIRSRDTTGDSWSLRLEDLKEFKRVHGHCMVPSRYEPNPELGVWVVTQRTQHRIYMRGKETEEFTSTSMNEDRIGELERLGFVWVLRNGRAATREDGPMDEAVAAAEAAAAAVEAADSVMENYVPI